MVNETDRELLIWAAKAAGYKKYFAHYLGRDSFVTYDEEYYSEIKERRVVGEKTLDWNPLADDGDALRLAVKLRIDLLLWIYTDSVLAQTSIGAGRGIPLQGEYVRPVNDHKEPKGNDPYAATRRAIVRAAAEIGRNMS